MSRARCRRPSSSVNRAEWLEADLDPYLEPYDWGDQDPMASGESVRYVPGVGWVVGEEEEAP